MEWHPAEWSVCLPAIFPCTTKSRRRLLLALAHLGSPRKRAVKWLCVVSYVIPWNPGFKKFVVVLSQSIKIIYLPYLKCGVSSPATDCSMSTQLQVWPSVHPCCNKGHNNLGEFLQTWTVLITIDSYRIPQTVKCK